MRRIPWKADPRILFPATVAELLFLTAMPCCSTVALTVLLMTVAVSLLLSRSIPFANAELTVLPSMMAFLAFVSSMPCAPEPVFCTMLPISCAPSLALILIAESSATVVTTVLPVSVALELPSSMRIPLTCAVSTVQF